MEPLGPSRSSTDAERRRLRAVELRVNLLTLVDLAELLMLSRSWVLVRSHSGPEEAVEWGRPLLGFRVAPLGIEVVDTDVVQ